MAVLLSDACINYSESLWTEAVRRGVVGAEVKAHFDQLKQGVYYGQCLDLLLGATNQNFVIADLTTLMQEKTARYSFYYPLFLGALVAGQERNVEWIEPFTLNLGITFQIIDDILGTFGMASLTGKSTNSDIAQRKQTILAYLALDQAEAGDKEVLVQHYGTDRVDHSQGVRQIFVRYGIEAMCRDLAKQYYLASMAALEQAALRHDQKLIFEELAEFVLNRTY